MPWYLHVFSPMRRRFRIWVRSAFFFSPNFCGEKNIRSATKQKSPKKIRRNSRSDRIPRSLLKTTRISNLSSDRQRLMNEINKTLVFSGLAGAFVALAFFTSRASLRLFLRCCCNSRSSLHGSVCARRYSRYC